MLSYLISTTLLWFSCLSTFVKYELLEGRDIVPCLCLHALLLS